MFVGVSVQLQNPADVTALHDAVGVVAVYPVQRFRPLALQATPVSPEAARAVLNSETFAPHVMTQVDRLHREGRYGKGVTVAILDAGIDYTHPALNGGLPAGQACFGKPECTVTGGYDLVGDSYYGSNTAVPDSDPFADCDGSQHGSHVAGTIAANDTTLGFTGVAPQAKIKAYRIFGCAVSRFGSLSPLCGRSQSFRASLIFAAKRSVNGDCDRRNHPGYGKGIR